MDETAFQKLFETETRRLLEDARKADELSFLFAVLGINAGVEDAGWQPIEETQQLVADLLGLINSPLRDDTKVRLALLLYCHITEANFFYHCLYNMLLTIQGKSPKVFSFLDKFKNGVPPSVSMKLSEIKAMAVQYGYPGIKEVLDEMIRPDIRNAFFHSDYVLFNAELRLKHKGGQYTSIQVPAVLAVAQNAVHFFEGFMKILVEARRSFPKDYKITGRKTPDGQPLSSISVRVNEQGIAYGFSSSDPLPLWGYDR